MTIPVASTVSKPKAKRLENKTLCNFEIRTVRAIFLTCVLLLVCCLTVTYQLTSSLVALGALFTCIVLFACTMPLTLPLLLKSNDRLVLTLVPHPDAEEPRDIYTIPWQYVIV